MLPPIPAWTSLHPLIVHMPIAFALVAPAIWLAYLIRPSRTEFRQMTWFFTAIAAVGSYLAVASGEASAELVMRTDAISFLIEKHEGLAETTRALLSSSMVALTTLIAIDFVQISIFEKWRKQINWLLKIAIFALLCSAAYSTAWTGHYGGLLVHKEGVRVDMSE